MTSGKIFINNDDENLAQNAMNKYITILNSKLPDEYGFNKLSLEIMSEVTKRLMDQKKYKEVEPYVIMAIEGYKKLNEKFEQGKMLVYYSVVQRFKKMPIEAKKSLDMAFECISSYEDHIDSNITLLVYFELGNYEYRNKNYAAARNYYSRIMKSMSYDLND